MKGTTPGSDEEREGQRDGMHRGREGGQRKERREYEGRGGGRVEERWIGDYELGRAQSKKEWFKQKTDTGANTKMTSITRQLEAINGSKTNGRHSGMRASADPVGFR